MLLLCKAKYNILIPNQHYFHTNWSDRCKCFDLIICKTEYCFNIFKEFVEPDKVVFTGWATPCIDTLSKIEKTNEWLLLYNDIYMTNINKLLLNWSLDKPVLNIVIINSQIKKVDRVKKKNINYIDSITNTEFSNLFNRCMYHICLDEMDCFNHAMYQCHLSASVPVIVDSCVNNSNKYSINIPSSKKRYKNGLGSIYTYSNDDFEKTIVQVLSNSDESMTKLGTDGMKFYTGEFILFRTKIMELFKSIFEKTKHIRFNKTVYSDDELPTVSIVTPIHNLKKMFRMAMLNYLSTNYPKQKLEWIIIDDSDETNCVKELLPERNEDNKSDDVISDTLGHTLTDDSRGIHYVRLNSKTSYGAKLNMAIDRSSHDIILIMNPDDFFYENGIRSIITTLKHTNKNIVGITICGGFDINNCVSIIESPNPFETYCTQLYTGGLCFNKSYWDKNKFSELSDDNIYPLKGFIDNKLDNIHEYYFQDIIVRLIHSYNINNFKIDTTVPNGCHFKFSKKLFEFVCSLEKVVIQDTPTDDENKKEK